MLCPNEQKFLKPIYNVTRKGRPFILTKIHQQVFEEIKTRLSKPPVLHLPDNREMFQLFPYIQQQTQHYINFKNCPPKSIGIASKRLPLVAVNYSVMELGLLGL